MSDYIAIQLSVEHAAIVDSDTYDRLKFLQTYTWIPQVHKRANKVYAVARGSSVSMHRAITGAVKGQHVDHKNGNGLDNRLSNLRLCSAGQNRVNSQKDKDNQSGFKGVSWARTSRKWQATIVAKGVKYHLGVFEHQERAAKAYDRAALHFHGEFAGLNFENLREHYRPKAPVPPKRRP